MKVMAVVATCGFVLFAAVAMSDDQAAKVGDAKAMKAQTVCPVMGGKINKSLFVDVEGKRIYICCKGCEGAIKKDPAKYIKKMEADGVTLEAVPADTNAVKNVDAPAKAQ
jgi:YHS domain-containing protein